jgi:sigma-B regulation protein RsbU (phosphoserine phosphatase)
MTAAPPHRTNGTHSGQPTLRSQILALVAGLNIASTIVACAIAFHFQKMAFLHGVDRVLMAGAVGAEHIYGEDFVEKLVRGAQFTPQEELAHIARISDLATRVDLKYVGALVQRDGKFYYAISSSPPHELEEGTYDRFWTEYDEAPQALIDTFRDGRMRFVQHEDRYGKFRSGYVPFRFPGSNKVDYVYGADIGLDYIYGHLFRTLLKTAGAGVVISLVSLWLTWILARHISGPMAKLAGLIRSVVENDFRLDTIRRTTLETIAEKSHEEVACVANAFCRMEGRLENYLVELQETTAERERIRSELSIAHDIQMGLLPRRLPQLPGCDVFARVIPAKEVGGDLFEVAALDDRRLLLVVADVSGKGISAGMFMAVTKTLLDAARGNYDEPHDLVRFLNEHLSAENEACMFVTMFLAIFDTHTGKLHYTNAGHNPPYIRRENGVLETLEGRHGMALGIAAGQTYQSNSATLGSGDLLLLFSDGVTEAQDVNESLFSEERLEACLRRSEHEDAGETATAVIDQVRQFQGAAAQFDDITLVTLRYTAPVQAALETTLA